MKQKTRTKEEVETIVNVRLISGRVLSPADDIDKTDDDVTTISARIDIQCLHLAEQSVELRKEKEILDAFKQRREMLKKNSDLKSV